MYNVFTDPPADFSVIATLFFPAHLSGSRISGSSDGVREIHHLHGWGTAADFETYKG